MTEPCELSAVAARRALVRKSLSPRELLDSCIQRIEAVDGAVNAMVARCFERAVDEAEAAEQAIMRGDRLGVVHGLPLGVKDLNLTQGLRTTFGSLLHANDVPESDERIVRDLRAHGAIVVGKTNTPEFGAGANTVNKVYGATRNPFDTRLTCGGSSGGSAVALATDMAPICTGSDTGGSLRTPASFCGVVAIRCSQGVVPSDRRAIGLTTYNVQGPMARSVADANLMLRAMASTSSVDPMATPTDPARFDSIESVDLSSLRVAFSADLGFAHVDDGIRRTFADRMQRLSPLFASCEPKDPDMAAASRVFWLIRGVHFLASHTERYRQHKEQLGPNVVANVEAALAMRPEDIAWAYAENTAIYRRFQTFFDDVDVLITPTVAVPPFPVEQLYCDTINGQRMESYIQWVDVVAGITLTGHPAVQIPCGLGPTGMPFGLQIVGPRMHADRLTIGVAAALEEVMQATSDMARPRPDVDALVKASAQIA